MHRVFVLCSVLFAHLEREIVANNIHHVHAHPLDEVSVEEEEHHIIFVSIIELYHVRHYLSEILLGAPYQWFLVHYEYFFSEAQNQKLDLSE